MPRRFVRAKHIDLDELFQEFLTFYLEHKASPAKTWETFKEALAQFQVWYTTNTHLDSPIQITKADLMTFKEWMQDNQYAASTILMRFSIIKLFYQWAETEGHIEASPFPRKLTIRGAKQAPALVPTPQQIFQMRCKSTATLKQALLLEMLLSTGMRIGELSQIRCCDLKLDRRPRDIETGSPSQFFGGSIFINSANAIIKRRKSRWVYFSKAALRILPRYLARYNIDIRSDLPLFPWHKEAYHELRKLGQGIIVSENEFLLEQNGLLVVQRTHGYRDISPDNAAFQNLDPAFRKAIKKRQDKEAEFPKNVQVALQGNVTRVRPYLGNHSLRYAFCCYMYYKSPMGERRCEERVRTLLGHSNLKTTHIYLMGLDYVANDHVWQQLWMGKGHDWRMCQ